MRGKTGEAGLGIFPHPRDMGGGGASKEEGGKGSPFTVKNSVPIRGRVIFGELNSAALPVTPFF